MNQAIHRSNRRGVAKLRGLVLSSLLLLSAPCVFAQSGTGTITGRIINAGTGEYLRNAVISVEGSGVSTLAQEGGNFRLSSLPAGPVKITITYAGLDPQTIMLDVAAGQTVQKDISLTNKSYEEVVVLGAFEVSTEREGNARAIMEQRHADYAKKVISADAIGSVSEGNVGEFLKLMPGVSMDYVEADTRQMRVRGLNPKYATVMLDGMQVADAASGNVATGRGFEFEQLSISSIETVELSKSPTPDQPSSVAGTVNLKTKGAFDRKGRRMSYSASLASNSYYVSLDKTQGWDDEPHRKLLPNSKFEYSDVLLDGKLGIIAGFSTSYTIATQKHVWNWYNNNNTNTADDLTEVPVINRIWFQDGPKPTERGNYNLRLDYMVTPDLRVYGRFDINTYEARFFNRTLSLYPVTYDNTVEYSKTSQTVSVGNVDMDTNQFRRKKGQTSVLTSGASYNKGSFEADISGHYSRSASWYDATRVGQFSDVAARLSNISWKMTRGAAGAMNWDVAQLSGPSMWNPMNYSFKTDSVMDVYRRSLDQQYTAKIDLKNKFEIAGNPNTLSYGGLANQNVLDIHRYESLLWSFTGPDHQMGTADDPKVIDYIERTFQPDWGAGGNLNKFPTLSPFRVFDRFKTNPNDFVENYNNNAQKKLRDNWNFKETIKALYIQDSVKIGKMTVAPGLRWEGTDDWGRGAKVLSDAKATEVSKAPVGSNDWMVAKYGTRITGGNEYSNMMKYLHTTYEFNKRFIVRAAYHDAITRADIANLIPGISAIDDDNKKLTASNPDLKPERSKNINVSAEYYFEPVGLISITGFYGTVKDLQYAGNQTTLGSDGYEGDKSYAGWTLTSPFNVSKTIKRKGIEIDYQQQLSFLPGKLKGLGVFANYTYNQYDDWGFYLGSPTSIKNAGVSYSLGRFFGRINCNWVGKILQNPARAYDQFKDTWTYAAPYMPEYQDSRTACDINLEYKLSRYVTLTFDARNVFNEPSVYTYRGIKENTIRILRTGSILMFGVKGTF